MGRAHRSLVEVSHSGVIPEVKVRKWILCTCALLLAGCQSSAKGTSTLAAAPRESSSQSHREPARAYGRLPLGFEPNVGQTDADVEFLARGNGYVLFLERDRAVLTLRERTHARTPEGLPSRHDGLGRPTRPSPAGARTALLTMELLGASLTPLPAAGLEPLSGKINYYRGNEPKHWQLNVPTYAKVRFPGVYPGIDVVYYGNQGELEEDFVVRPGADPTTIRLGFEGGKPALNLRGDLVVSLGGAEVRLPKPVVYQESGGVRRAVDGRFVLAGDHEVRFKVARFDPMLALVIDPKIVYSTYLGSSGKDGDDAENGIAVDSTGSVIVVGETPSATFPTTKGALSTTLASTPPNEEAFITKLSPDGSSLVFSTFLGGAATTASGGPDSVARNVAVGPKDDIYVTGDAFTSDFPTTAGAYQTVLAQVPAHAVGWADAFVTKLTPAGALSYSTFVGGNGYEEGIAIAVDAAGHAYVAGDTNEPLTAAVVSSLSGGAPFPLTSSAYEGPFDYVASVGDVPTTPFVLELNPTGTALLYSTFLGAPAPAHYSGGNGSTSWPNSIVYSIAVRSNGLVYVGGTTQQNNFPTTPGAFMSKAPAPVVSGGHSAGFLAALDTSKSGSASLVYSTYLGGQTGAGPDIVYDVAVDPDGNLYATGSAGTVDFPTTAGAFGGKCVTDVATGTCPGSPYVAKLNPTGSALVYSTFLSNQLTNFGSLYNGFGYGIALDPARNAYVFGGGNRDVISVLDPPSAPAGGDTANSNQRDAFVVTVASDGSRLLFASYLGGSAGQSYPEPFGSGVGVTFGGGIALDADGNVYVSSSTNASNFPVTPGVFQPECGSSACAPGPTNVYITKISPVGTTGARDGGSEIAPDASTSGASDGSVAGGSGGSQTGSTRNGAGGAGSGIGGSSGSSAGGKTTKGSAGTSPSGDGSTDAAGGGEPVRRPGSSGGGCRFAPGQAPAKPIGWISLATIALLRRRRGRGATTNDGAHSSTS